MSALVALTAQNTRRSPPSTSCRPSSSSPSSRRCSRHRGRAAKTGMLFSRPLIEAVAGSSRRTGAARRRPGDGRASGARLLQEDAVEALVARLFPLATVVTPNLPEARALDGLTRRAARELAARLVEPRRRRGARHGRPRRRPVDHLFDGRDHVEIPVERLDVAATHGAGCTHSATLAAMLARGCRSPTPRAARHAPPPRRCATGCPSSARATGRSTSST